MQRRSRASKGRFRGTLAGAESFLQIDRSPIGIICLARACINPGDSWLIYALPLSILRYIHVQSHCRRKASDLLLSRELLYVPAGPLHAFSGKLPVEDTGLIRRTAGAGSIAADSRMHRIHFDSKQSVSSGSYDPRLSVGREPHPTRSFPWRQSGMLNADLAGKPDMAGISMRIPRYFGALEAGGKPIERANIFSRADFPKLVLSKTPEMSQLGRFSEPAEQFERSVRRPRGRNTAFSEEPAPSFTAQSGNHFDSKQSVFSGSFDPRLSAGRDPHPTRQEPEHSYDRVTSVPNPASLGKDGISSSMHLQEGSSARFIQFRSFPWRQSGMLTADIVGRSDMAAISMRASRDLWAFEAGGKPIERANISSRADFPKLVLSKTPGISQSGSFSEPAEQFQRSVRRPRGRNTAFSEEPAHPLMAPAVRQQPPEASGHTWHMPTFSGEGGQDLAEAPRGADLNSLAEKVYTIIERRKKIEMERRGLYSRS